VSGEFWWPPVGSYLAATGDFLLAAVNASSGPCPIWEIRWVVEEKWRLGLDMVDEMVGWGLRPPLMVADAGYSDAAEFRQGLEDRDIPYVVHVASTATAYPQETDRGAPTDSGLDDAHRATTATTRLLSRPWPWPPALTRYGT
jgi:hypothetical protein